jgi:hypothetical protein
MSLVHEALQKAGREKLRKTGIQLAPAQRPPPRPAQPFAAVASKPAETVATFAVGKPVEQSHAPVTQKKQPPLLPALVVCVAAVAIVAIVFLVSLAASAIRDSRQTVRANTSINSTPVANATEPTGKEPSTPPLVVSEPVTPTAQQPPPPSNSGFKLTGIMIVPNAEPSAVINGRVVYESSYVDGATVKSIERDHVTLVDAQGKEIVLHLD